MTEVRKLALGVPGFDVISNGGIPEGRSTLVAGRSGTGKTLLGLQVASHLARSGVNTVLLAVEEPPEDLITCADSLGLDMSGAIRAGTIVVSDVTRPMDGPMVVSGEYDISGLMHRVEYLVKQLGARALVLDSVTALFSPRPPAELLRSLFFQLVHGFRKMGLTSVLLAEGAPDSASVTTLGVEDYVCDMVVLLRNVFDAERRRRSIEINKYRRSAHYKGEYPCAITSRGLTIFPLDARENGGERAAERYSSGLPALDAMISGGLLRDSIAIVRGPTGSGKTLLAGLYARAGALRGERVSYWGFEEPRAVLLRNFAAIGMPMEDLEAKGLLKVTCSYPEAMGFEDLLVQLRNRLEDYDPSLIVLDSISSIEHSLSDKAFRQFMVGLASMLREHRRSALLTQTIQGGSATEHTAPYLSTIADMILALDYSPDDFDLNRTIRVLKMRGSAHTQTACRLRIGEGGLNIEHFAVKQESTRRRSDLRSRQLEGLHVLVVEDYGDAREATVAALLRDGADVTAVGSASEALEAAQQHAFDAIVCDLGLPDVDGYTLLERLRGGGGRGADTPAVALTGWTLPEERQRAQRAGFAGFLRKPVALDELRDMVARLAGASAAAPATRDGGP
jgi:circadian clock protein KaiC